MSLFTQFLLSSTPQPPPAESTGEPLWRIIVQDLPYDASAIVVYTLLVAVVWLIWWANRHSGDSRPERAPIDAPDPAPHEAHALRRPVDGRVKPDHRGTPKPGRPRRAA